MNHTCYWSISALLADKVTCLINYYIDEVSRNIQNWVHLTWTSTDSIDVNYAQSKGYCLTEPIWLDPAGISQSKGIDSSLNQICAGCSYYSMRKEPKRTEEPKITVLLEPNRTGTESGTGTGTTLPRSLPIILRKPEPWPWVAQCLSDIVSWCDCLVDHHRLLVRKFPISYRILFLRNQKTTYCPFPFAYSHYPIGTVSAQLMAHDGLFTISLRRGVVCRRHLQVFFQLYEESRCDSHRVKRCKYWACIHSFCFQMSESNDTHANEVCPVCDEPYFL